MKSMKSKPYHKEEVKHLDIKMIQVANNDHLSIYHLSGGVIVGDTGLCCCVQCVTSIVRLSLKTLSVSGTL